jgi:hypothetical protein
MLLAMAAVRTAVPGEGVEAALTLRVVQGVAGAAVYAAVFYALAPRAIRSLVRGRFARAGVRA